VIIAYDSIGVDVQRRAQTTQALKHRVPQAALMPQPSPRPTCSLAPMRNWQHTIPHPRLRLHPHSPITSFSMRDRIQILQRRVRMPP